jgi:ABC-type lipoprotein export system ATPase subunit/ABC-type antimicrobial peptide transport system permease subunit
MELIRLENVHKVYHVGEIDVPVLNGVSLSIRQGELVALMGASGSGKTTLMNILGCLDRPTSGKYYLDGQEISTLAADRRALVRTAKLGFVFQSFNLLPRTTAVQNVIMPLDYAAGHRSHPTAIARAKELLTRVGLADRMEHVPSQMSGGQQQRVAIARALVNKPALLLADEPTGNLDSHTGVEILEMFQQLNAAGITIILVTHDEHVAAYAHRVIRLTDGLITDDTQHTAPVKLPPPAPHHVKANGHPVPRDHAPPEGNGRENGHGNGDGPHLPSLSVSAGGEGAVGTVAATRVQTQRARPQAPAEGAPSRETRVRAGLSLKSLVPATWRTAVGALRRNLMRSVLTTLGIVIGIGAVIAMVEISEGARTSLIHTMSSMGANMLIVQSGAAASGGVSWGQGSEKTLTPQDAEEIGKQCPAIVAVAPQVQGSGQVVYGNRNWVPQAMYGTTPAYLTIRDWEYMDEGELFTDRDVLAASKVCVIGKTLARELFQGESPIGHEVRVRNVGLRVIGVLGRKGGSMMGMDQDDILITPWTTMKYRVSGESSGFAKADAVAAAATGAGQEKINSLSEIYPAPTSLYPEQSLSQQANTPQPVRFINVETILAKAESAEKTPEAIEQITALLHERHRIRPGEEDDFTIRDLAELIKAMSSMTRMMGGLLLIVAMISLAVGGVGIMNIMLVSVTERTREIGLRMAVGARAHHILRQFLIESVVLCLFGGAIGILLGRAATLMVWYFLRWPVQVSLPAIAAAFIVSAGVGIAFGFYPAWKASRLDPIDALRYE